MRVCAERDRLLLHPQHGELLELRLVVRDVVAGVLLHLESTY